MELKITTTEAEKILLEWAQARFPDAFNAVEIKTYTYSGEIAAHAMQGLIASPRGTPDGSDATDVYYAKCAYKMADAMMEARNAAQ